MEAPLCLFQLHFACPCSPIGDPSRARAGASAPHQLACFSQVTSIAVSHDGQCILASRMDSRLVLVDKDGGDLLASYAGHKHESIKIDCALTPSDEFVVCGSEDGTTMLMML